MKYRFFFILCTFILLPFSLHAADAGLRFINSRGEIRCGTDLSVPDFASKTEDGKWRGFDADICRAFSYAIFGRGDRFTMVDVKTNTISKALESNKIDFMLGGSTVSANLDVSPAFAPATLLYYDHQAFLARDANETESMNDFNGAKVCVMADSPELNNIEEFSDKYNLNLKPLVFGSQSGAVQGFLLNRCRLLTGGRIFLRGIQSTHFGENSEEENGIRLLPEPIALLPYYLITAKDNDKLQNLAYWMINALQLADIYGVNYHNASVQIGLRNTSQRNLFGEDPKLWLSLGLTPNWVRSALVDIGNYGEIYDRNFGRFSRLKFDRAENNYLKNGGLINPSPFL